jgi:toxin ParE1/3/4
MKAIRVAAPAERDLDHIWYYIARKSGGAEIANGLIDTITETFALFSREPEAGTKRDEIELGLRSFPVKNYIIYYRHGPQFVTIARVIHGMRNQETAYAEE